MYGWHTRSWLVSDGLGDALDQVGLVRCPVRSLLPLSGVLVQEMTEEEAVLMHICTWPAVSKT